MSLLADFPKAWRPALEGRVDAGRLQQLEAFLVQERAEAIVFPPAKDVFNALRRVKPEDVKVVLLGQDPYHGEGEAHGFAFSVPRGVKVPPSLRNLFKELRGDLGIEPPGHGNLEAWADQGVLLLNTVLSVRKDQAGSHRGRGWEEITDAVLRALNEQRHRVVFVLLGKDAQKKAGLIDGERHMVIAAPHPSPLSAHSGFFGCGLFSRANAALEAAGREPVRWALPP